MQWKIPGTVLMCPREDATKIDQRFEAMFLGGGIVLSQVVGVPGLESYTVQNWVKRGFLSPPERKRYTQRQLCRIININMLKSVLPMERICGLLTYINGHLDDESDDMIDDSQLYFMFVRLASRTGSANDPMELELAIEKELADYSEPIPGAKERVAKVLKIMLIAWASAQLREKAEALLGEISTL